MTKHSDQLQNERKAAVRAWSEHARFCRLCDNYRRKVFFNLERSPKNLRCNRGHAFIRRLFRAKDAIIKGN